MSNINLLSSENEKINQPKNINILLMNHQLSIIKKMMDIENSGIIKIKLDKLLIPDQFNKFQDNTIENLEINTNVGILGDKVGAGKTLTVISLISINKQIKNRPIELGGSTFFSLKSELETTDVKTNLIIVPHKILPQWVDTFNKYSNNLSVYKITTNKEIDNIIKTYAEIKKNWKNENYTHKTESIDYEKINKLYDVIIVSDTMIRRLNKTFTKIKWNRIFIDEADTISVPSYFNIKFNFLWLVTGTPHGMSKRKNYISNIFNKGINTYYYSNELIKTINIFTIRNDNEYIDQSIKLPHPNRYKILCLTPKEVSIIKNIIPSNILQMINAGNSEEAIKALNFNVDTNDNIFKVITKNIKDNIQKKETELALEKNRLEYEIANFNNNERQANVKSIENSLNRLHNKYNDIKQKIYELNDDYCPVCMDEFKNPVIVSCCNNCFCFDCLAVSLGELHNNKCPYCRQITNLNEMHIISNETNLINKNKDKENKSEIKDKIDVLLDLIINKPNASIMIFANYSETFNKIKVKLSEFNISYHILKGTASSVDNYINDFKNKKVRVLMLNAKYFGAGMNLQMTTDLIIYHRFNEEMEEQIIGRAQRFGRKTPLNVYYLLHENESNDIKNKFKFQEKDYNKDDINNEEYKNEDESNKENEEIIYRIKNNDLEDDFEINLNKNEDLDLSSFTLIK